jgi:hypothetical protein
MIKEPSSIPLSEALQRLFPEPWARLVALKGGEAKALEAVDQPDSGHLVFARRQRLASGGLSGEPRDRALEQEDAVALVESVLAELRRIGEASRISADGIFVGSGQRQTIPVELWERGKFEFRRGAFTSGAFAYDHVRLRLETGVADDETAVVQVANWLRRRRAERGDEPKKQLSVEASKAFGAPISVREFNAAYAHCYGRSRGRPKKTK